MEEQDKTILPLPHFLRKKNEKTFREVYKLLEGLTIEEVDEILRAISAVAPKVSILRKL